MGRPRREVLRLRLRVSLLFVTLLFAFPLPMPASAAEDVCNHEATIVDDYGPAHVDLNEAATLAVRVRTFFPPGGPESCSYFVYFQVDGNLIYPGGGGWMHTDEGYLEMTYTADLGSVFEGGKLSFGQHTAEFFVRIWNGGDDPLGLVESHVTWTILSGSQKEVLPRTAIPLSAGAIVGAIVVRDDASGRACIDIDTEPLQQNLACVPRGHLGPASDLLPPGRTPIVLPPGSVAVSARYLYDPSRIEGDRVGLLGDAAEAYAPGLSDAEWLQSPEGKQAGLYVEVVVIAGASTIVSQTVRVDAAGQLLADADATASG